MTESSKPPLGRRMKAHAPPPPQVPQPAPRHIFRSSTPDGGGTPGMDTKENILKPTVELTLTLPQGYRTSVIEDGSKALMDLLVELCSRYHLNPALHTLELVSPEGHSVGFKPNALLGSLNVAAVLIKEKVWEEKVRRPAPKVPEKSVRLMVNYHGSQKAVVRVNPLVPLQALIPVICDKCEFEAAHVLLLKDSISRHELPLDKSLTELGIKELYVRDQSLVLQPKMASAPALNYTEDPVYSSTASLGRPGKKGFLGIFQFRRKSKALSTVTGIPCLEDRTVTLGQSQSFTSIPRMSPKAETKKRRAPVPPGAPTPTMGHTSYEGFEMGLGSESQQRKRKAPAPPPSPTSVTLGSDDASACDAPTPESCDTETPTSALFTRVAQSVTVVSAPTVVTQPAKLDPFKIAVQLRDDGPNRSSPTPSSSTADSLTVQDSSSELSHSINDSDTDLDQAGSHCSTLTSSSESGSARVQTTTTTTTRFSTKVEESASGTTARLNQEVASDSSSRSETESALNLKLEEVENNRHSAIGNSDRPVPPKPRRSPAREPPQPVKPPTLPTLHSPFPPIESTESNRPQNFMEVEEAAPQSWLHSMQSSAASGQKPLPEAPEDETLSLGSSSSGGSSLPDQGYAASEGMAEGEDSGMVSSLSDTQPTSPDGSLSLDGNSRERGEKLRGPPRDSSSDSDEGCATWGSIHRHNDISPQAESARLKKSYVDDNELTAQLHQTLADFEADLAGHVDVVSAKDTSYTTSRDSNEVPVSIVDMDVPVTAIDEVLEEYERHNVEHETKSLNRTKSASSKGSDFKHKSNVEPQNKNNNACTAAVSDKKSIATTKQSSQLERGSKPRENKFISIEKGEKIETKMKKTVVADANRVKENKPAVAAKSNVDMNGKSTGVCSEKGADPPSHSQRSVSAKKDEDMYKVYQTISGLSTAQGKITRNVTSRFGMKTFTVVPPKPAVVHAATEQPAVRSTTGAIRIDDQGNMVTAGMAWNKVDGSSESETNSSKVSPLLGKAKVFWSSNERHDSVHCKSPIEKESKNSLKNVPTALIETQMKNRSMEQLETTQSALSKNMERIQLGKVVKEEFDEPEDEVKVSKEEQVEVENKTSKSFQLPSNKPALPPPLLPDLKRDLSFLKPPRRTSSQYVASAINKYAPKSSAQPTSIPKTHDYSTSLQRSGRSIQVNPHQSSQSFFSDNKENVTVFTSKPSGPIRSMSYPEYVSDSQRDFGEERRDRGGFENQVVSTKETLDRLEAQSANNNHIQSSGSTRIKVTTLNNEGNIKHIRPRSPSPATVKPFHSSTKPPTAPKIISQTLTNSSDDTTKTATHPSSITRPQPSVTVSDSGVTPGPPAVTLFGPITKFRPVIHKAVEKETSLHSSLMEAIQTGGGRGRLKKQTSTSSPSSVMKVSYKEEESERSALLAAVRARSSSSRLRKTKSEAADELEKFRKEASEEQRNLGPSSSPSSPSLTCTSPVSNPPPPPPPAPTVAPPPPPPVLPQAKPCSVAHPNTNASMNPSLAREAMLEAIRSGSAAEKLKKVAAPTKTLQVNGRLGTIQPTSSTSIPQ